MNKLSRLSAVMAFIYLVCMFKSPAGVTFVIFTITMMIACAFATKEKGYSIKPTDYLYAVACVLISVSVILTDSRFLHLCSKAGIVMLMIVYFIKKFYNIENLGLIRGILSMFEFVVVGISHISSPLRDYQREKKRVDEREENDEESVRSQIIKGLIIAVPLLIIVGVLLVSADAVFRNILSNIFDSSADMKVIFQMFITFVLAFLVFYAAGRTIMEGRLKLNDLQIKTSKPVTAITFTTVLSVVYVLFCGVQIAMLLSGGKNLLPDGYTYSDYAREGFFQLLFVALINYAIVFFCKIKFEKNKVLNGILTLITGCTYVMLISSAVRMIMYIQEYHLTFLRLIVLWFLVILAFLMGGLIISVFNRDYKLFEYSMIVVTVFYILLAFARPDAVVAKYNVEYLDKKGEQIEYMTTLLSDDAAVYLAEIENHNWMLDKYFSDIISNYDDRDVRKFNVSSYKAYEAAKEYFKR